MNTFRISLFLLNYFKFTPNDFNDFDGFVFRYNTRGFSESYRFDYVLNNINNRLTYKELKNVRSN